MTITARPAVPPDAGAQVIALEPGAGQPERCSVGHRVVDARIHARTNA
ncbi:hypothetical protein [Streptomyces sp. NWU339]|nr:hypothetical protein [Streptomyces sp. NWU339]